MLLSKCGNQCDSNQYWNLDFHVDAPKMYTLQQYSNVLFGLDIEIQVEAQNNQNKFKRYKILVTGL